jgi:predicted nucleic acid-binding protein
LSVISLGEILKGITILPESRRREGLQEWLDGTPRPWFEGRILPVTAPIAERWGVLSGECRLEGRQVSVADGLIVATALHLKLTVVTRNVRDFTGLGVAVLNPWDAA